MFFCLPPEFLPVVGPIVGDVASDTWCGPWVGSDMWLYPELIITIFYYYYLLDHPIFRQQSTTGPYMVPYKHALSGILTWVSVSVYLNLTHALNRLATTAGFTMRLLLQKL